MRFIKYLTMSLMGLLAGCTSTPLPPPSAPATPPAAPVAGPGRTPPPAPGVPAAPAPTPQAPVVLAPARNWDEYKIRAARKIVQTSPGETFDGPLPDPLGSIPVLQVHLNRDGSVRNITTLRTPRYFPETLQMASRAIRRAAPFESVAHLPQPWQFSETFLYNDALKFQVRTLVESR